MLESIIFYFFFNDTATTEIYTLSLHDALPISQVSWRTSSVSSAAPPHRQRTYPADRKSTRLNSSHSQISYAVFCLKKKKTSSLRLACSYVARTYKSLYMITQNIYNTHSTTRAY